MRKIIENFMMLYMVNLYVSLMEGCFWLGIFNLYSLENNCIVIFLSVIFSNLIMMILMKNFRICIVKLCIDGIMML